MAYTGLAAFRTALGALSVTGVEASGRLLQRPETLSVSLPVSFPRMPTARSANITLGGTAGLKVGTMEFVIVVEAANLKTENLNLTSVCTLMDALDTALRGAINSLGLDEWEMRAQADYLGDSPYWMIVATITASGNA